MVRRGVMPMKQIIKDALLKYYTERNEEEYLKKCKSELTLPPKIKEFIQNNQFRVIEMNFGGDSWPSSKWLFDLGLCEVNGFKVHYTSSLMISKLVQVYYLQHEFSVDNLDPLRTIPKLDGFDVQPFTKSQQELEDIIDFQLIQHQLSKLSFNELNEVIIELAFPKDVSIFGSQVTVEYALFHDLLDLC